MLNYLITVCSLATISLLFIKSVFASNIRLNEFYATGGSSSDNPDWVEIYNEGYDLSLYQVTDADNHEKDLSGADCNGRFCTIDWHNLLNKDGDIITLSSKLHPDTSIDQISYGNRGGISAPGIGQSAGRNPDGTGVWEIYSNPTKGSANQATISPTPEPTPTLTPVLSPTPTTSATANSSSFTVSNIPTQINSDQSFSVLVNLQLPNNPSTTYYLSSAFKKVDGTRYFGLTKFNGDWVKYDSGNYPNQYKITTDSSGRWNNSIEVKPDISDSDYKGSGNYIFKVFRYTSNGSQTWSNETTVNIQNINSGTAQTTQADTPNPSANPKTTPQPSSSSNSKSTSYKTTPSITYRLASIAAVTTSSPSAFNNIQVKSNQQINIFKILGIIFLLSGLIMILYLFVKSRLRSKSL